LYPKIPKFRRIGQSGQLEVASLLSNFANVMIPEYDVGLDFFCELIENDTPSGVLFWVQAKATKDFGSFWCERIDKKTIRLWLKRTSPVFIIVLERSSGLFYWASVHDNREQWLTELDNREETINVRVERLQQLERFGENLDFVKKIRHDTILVNAVHGIPSMIGDGYVRSIPVLRLSNAARESVRQRVRLGFDYLIGDSWLKSNLQEAYQLGKLLASFDTGHYDHFVFLARVCRQLAKTEEAKTYYRQAIEVCKSDPNWNKLKTKTDPFIEEIIENLENELNSVEDKSN
jgi:tetratricopeptide (TPR) repeat protein